MWGSNAAINAVYTLEMAYKKELIYFCGGGEKRVEVTGEQENEWVRTPKSTV